MRIVLLVDWHSDGMGYSDNCLPKALASLGHDVHLVTSNGQVYFDSPMYKDVFEQFLGPGVVACGESSVDGYVVHRMPHGRWRGRLRVQGVQRKLRSLRPEIVQAGELHSVSTYEAAVGKLLFGYKFFVECHIHASVFPAARDRRSRRQRAYWLAYRTTMRPFLNMVAERFYPISDDASNIAVQFFGVDARKVTVRSLGVDTDLFRPICDESSQQARMELRRRFGFSPADLVCIYTGRLSYGKGAIVLARAVARLVAEGEAVRGLFVGHGAAADVELIRSSPGCVVHPLMPMSELPRFYWAGDIGVWPRQESTSQLDAAASGLPLILSNRVSVLERMEGNGVLYQENDVEDLAKEIRALRDPTKRKQMGEIGVRRMRERFSWTEIAKQYVRDYEAALRG